MGPGDPDGYAQQMTTSPLPDTPAHTVLMQVAYGDFQVSMYSAAVEARTVGASVYRPALDAGRTQDVNLFDGLPTIKRYPFGGSALEIWDSGPGRVQPPPLANIAPVKAQTTSTPTRTRARCPRRSCRCRTSGSRWRGRERLRRRALPLLSVHAVDGVSPASTAWQEPHQVGEEEAAERVPGLEYQHVVGGPRAISSTPTLS